jgi:hypothetical protein
MEQVPEADYRQILEGCVMLYGKALVKFLSVRDGYFKLLRLKTGKINTIRHNELDWASLSPPRNRIGFVNTQYGCAFLSRTPKRMFHAGLHNHNIAIIELPRAAIPQDNRVEIVEIVATMESSDILDSYYNRFPSLEEAISEAKAKKIPIAFDRQFAVCPAGSVYFKNTLVGTIKKKAVEFHEGFDYLKILLDFSYEKTSPTFSPKAV